MLGIMHETFILGMGSKTAMVEFGARYRDQDRGQAGSGCPFFSIATHLPRPSGYRVYGAACAADTGCCNT
ncbi:hypothetical protein SCFA_230010 [anaerobic digester metagenome]|uniref:Uncharacterized protein n=1 Tax=anaerobic digester metagenome TaxID=1263854 RepID=A0A485M0F0_9ZZZZ